MIEPLRVEDIISQIFIYVSATCFLAFLIIFGERWGVTGHPFPMGFDGGCLIISLILAAISYIFYKIARRKNREEDES